MFSYEIDQSVKTFIAFVAVIIKILWMFTAPKDLLCMSNLSHASILKEHDNNDDFQGRSRRTA